MSFDNQKHYAIVKLEEAARIIKQATNELPILRKRLERLKENKPKAREVYSDLQQQKNKLLSAFNTAILSLLEMELNEMAEYSVKLSCSVKAFHIMTPDYSKLCSVLLDYISKLPITDTAETKTTNAAIIGRLMANVKMGYYPTDIEHIKYIANGIAFPEDITVNLLDPCCGCGLALHTLAGENNCNTYGIELDRYRAEESLTRLSRVGFGSYFRSRISNEAFHMMLLNPPYLSVMAEWGRNTRSEKRFLIDALRVIDEEEITLYMINPKAPCFIRDKEETYIYLILPVNFNI